VYVEQSALCRTVLAPFRALPASLSPGANNQTSPTPMPATEYASNNMAAAVTATTATANARDSWKLLHQSAKLFKALLSTDPDMFFARAVHLVFVKNMTSSEVAEMLLERLRGHASSAALERFKGCILGGLENVGSGGSISTKSSSNNIIGSTTHSSAARTNTRKSFTSSSSKRSSGMSAGDALTILWSSPTKFRLLKHPSSGRSADPQLFERAHHGIALGPDLFDPDLPRLLLV